MRADQSRDSGNQGEISELEGEELTGLDLGDEKDSTVQGDSQGSGSGDCEGGDALRRSTEGIDLGKDHASNLKSVEFRDPRRHPSGDGHRNSIVMLKT